MNIKFSYAQCLRHAFMSGAGYGDLQRISDEDLARWTNWEPPITGSFAKVDKALNSASHTESLADWVEAALQCKSWNWDADQFEAALFTLNDYRKAIGKEPFDPKRDRPTPRDDAWKSVYDLVDIVADETGALTMPDADGDSVGWSEKGDLPMTFGHVRRAKAALDTLRDYVERTERDMNCVLGTVMDLFGVEGLSKVTGEALKMRQAAKIAPDLLRCINEISEWKRTGILPGSALRARAIAIRAKFNYVFDMSEALTHAEKEVAEEAMRAIAARGEEMSAYSVYHGQVLQEVTGVEVDGEFISIEDIKNYRQRLCIDPGGSDTIDALESGMDQLRETFKVVLAPLVAIADAYDASNLEEVRPEWNIDEPGKVSLFEGRGGKQLLTLQHCFAARDAVK